MHLLNQIRNKQKIMRARNIKKQIWINKEEDYILKDKAARVGLCEAELIRNLILGFEPKEKPDNRFYEVMRELRAIGNNINQIARRANTLNNIDCELYKTEAIKWNNFMLDIKKEFLLPKEIK